METMLTNEEKIYGLSLIWREAFYNFAYFDRLPDLNWNQAYRDFLPQVIAAEDIYSYYRVLSRFIALLQDGHTAVFYPPEVAAQHIDFPPVALQAMGQSAVVAAVEVSLHEALPLGSIVTSVDGCELKDHLQENVLPYAVASSPETRWEMAVRGVRLFGFGLLAGTPGSTALLTIHTPAGETRDVTVIRNLASRQPVWHGRPNLDLPVDPLSFEWLDGEIAYVALNSFMDSQIIGQFEAIKPELLKARGVVLDLRRNMGGSTGTGGAILDHFTDQELIGSRSRTRQSVAAHRAWGQHGGEQQPHASGDTWLEIEAWLRQVTSGPKILVPTAVLIGRGTISAAEDFLILADRIPHFTTIGAPTFGSTGQPLLFDLPGGGMGCVVTKHDTYPDGREFVGSGIQPKIPVTYTIRDYAAGTDADLQTAIQFLQSL
jgi:carboxyl-terminal processing protease